MAHGFNEDKTKANMISQDEYQSLAKVAYKSVGGSVVAVQNNTVTDLWEFDLPGAGTYIIQAKYNFNSTGNPGGHRRLIISSNPNATSWDADVVGTGNDYVTATYLYNGSGKIYIRAFQNSGAACVCTPVYVNYVRLY